MAIRAKLVIIIFVFAILPMFLLTQTWYRTAVESVVTVQRQGLDARAQEISHQLARLSAAYEAQSDELLSRPAWRTYAQALARDHQAEPDAAVRSQLGTFLATHPRIYLAVRLVNPEQEELFKVEGLTPPSRSALGLPVTSLLRDASGEVVAALSLSLDAEEVLAEAVGPRGAALSAASRSAAAARREVMVLAADGRVLYAANPAWQGQPYQDVLPSLVAQAVGGLRRGASRGQDIYRIGDQDWLMRMYPYPGRPDAERPQLSIFVIERYLGRGSLETVGNVMIGITFLLAIVATLLVYYFISGITDSIRRVTRGAKAIASGRLDSQINVKANDETGVLADAFNRMAARLREMIQRESEQKQFESFARLSAVLTHDLKNAILSLSFLVSNMERKFDREGFREDAMRTLADSVENLKSMVVKLSDPRAQITTARQPEDLSSLTRRVLERSATQAGERYQIELSCPPEVLAVVDRVAIERVVENLIINALEAMPEGGRLRVSTRLDGNQQAVIAVADTGQGMSAEFVRDRLFHPFATTKRKGIGLGLYSCREIIEQHEGRIEVTSAEGAGTEFRIVLPATSEAEQAVHAPPPNRIAIPLSRP